MREETIEKIINNGAKRWTKGNYDRLYINPYAVGVEYTYYKTGNIHTCTIDGDQVSNSCGYRLKASKTYIDIKTGEIHSDNDLMMEQAEKYFGEFLKDEQ